MRTDMSKILRSEARVPEFRSREARWPSSVACWTSTTWQRVTRTTEGEAFCAARPLLSLLKEYSEADLESTSLFVCEIKWGTVLGKP